MLLRKGIYSYENMDSRERFNETSLLVKKDFNSELNLEGSTDERYTHYKKVFKELGLKKLDDHYDLYVQCDTLLLSDVFKIFWNKYKEIYELEPAHFFISSRISMGSLFKKVGVKLELLTDYDILLMIEKGIRNGMCQAIHRYDKGNN